MIHIKTYTDTLKARLFELTDRCFSQCGKQFEPNGRHSFSIRGIAPSFKHDWALAA